MAKQKSLAKAAIATCVVALIVLGLAALAYAYFNQAQTATQSTEQTKPKKIVAAGDIVCPPTDTPTNTSCQEVATAALIGQLKPDAVLTLGDLQYQDGELADFNNAYEKTWGKFKDITYPVPGNHEYHTKGAAGYFGYFGERAGDPDKGYYSFDLGAWHIIALNSNCNRIDGCNEASAQGKWLQADLATNNKTCSLAYWHHPASSSGKYATSSSQLALGQALWQQVKGKVDVVLNGHDHIYERFAPQGNTTQFIAGTGGRSLYPKTVVHANSQKLLTDKFGVLALTLNADSYNWQFVGANSQVLDEGQSFCSN